MFACFSKIIIIFAPLNFKNINSMKNLIALKDCEKNITRVINPDHIVSFYQDADGDCVLSLSNGLTFSTHVELYELAERINKSYE